MRLFAIFLFIDLLSKNLAVWLNPNNGWFKLHYNPNMVMGIDLGPEVTFGSLLLIPVFYWMIKKSVSNPNPTAMALIFTGIFGNAIGRFSELGVVDFIKTPWFICNLADIFQWIGIMIIYYQGFKQSSSQRSSDVIN
jgi:lipoprotein signal peptidase